MRRGLGAAVLLLAASLVFLGAPRAKASTGAAADTIRVGGIVAVGAAPARPEPPPTPGLRAYERALRRHAREGLVDYSALASDRADLDVFLDEIAVADSTVLAGRSRHHQMAFWINAYNALTLDLVLRNLHGPDGKGPRLKSIRDIPDAFSRPRWVVAGARRSLDGVENGILRARFHDAQIHFALVCASRSCPALRTEAYTADSLVFQLMSASHAFLADTTRNDVRVRGWVIRLSRIFEWYGEDFAKAVPEQSLAPTWAYGPIQGGILTFLAVHDYLPRETVEAIAKGRVRIEFLPYDWSLNDAPSRR